MDTDVILAKYTSHKITHIEDQLYINPNDQMSDDIERFTEQIKNEQNDFEESLRNYSNNISCYTNDQYLKEINSIDSFRELAHLELMGGYNGTSDYVSCYQYMNNIGSNNTPEFDIIHGGDILHKIYLEIDFDDDCQNLSLKNKQKLLSNNVQLLIGGTIISEMSISICIFNSICKGENIKYEDNKMQIELFSFDTYNNSHKNTSALGIPMVGLCLHDVRVKFALYNYDEHFTININKYFKLLCHYINLPQTQRRRLAQYGHMWFVLNTRRNALNMKYIVDGFHELRNFYAKFLIVYFTPMFNNEDTLLIDYPEIYQGSLYSVANNKCTELLHWNSGNILTFDMFDITIYVFPLSSDVSTWENINYILKNPKKTSINNNKMPNESCKYFFQFDTTTSIESNYCVNIFEVIPNVARIMSGMFSFAYDF